MRRRSLALAGVAVAAGSAGLGAAIWRARHRDPDDPSMLWTLSFDRPGGGRLALSQFRGRPLLLNFWATWCPPCVSELPLLDRFQREQAGNGWQVAGLAVDNRTPVDAFLAKRPVSFAIGLAGTGGIELARQLGNAAGALPFSVVFDRRGNQVQHKLGVIAVADLETWVRQVP